MELTYSNNCYTDITDYQLLELVKTNKDIDKHIMTFYRDQESEGFAQNTQKVTVWRTY